MIYFFDDFAIEGMDGLTRVPGPVEKLGIVLQADRPSDGWHTMSFASSLVPLQNGGWRLYYTVFDGNHKTMRIAVAESAD